MTDPLAQSCCTTGSDSPYLELEPCPVRDAGTTRKRKLKLPTEGGEHGESSSRSEHTRTRNLVVSFLLMIIIGSGNKVFQKLQTIPMQNYPNFLNLWTTFMYIPFSLAYILPVSRFGLFDNAITAEHLSMPKAPFAVMGLLDSLAGIMQTFAAVYLPGPLLVLLPQAAIPISMALSKRVLHERYKCLQYVGAAVVMAGILVVLEPVITQRHGPSYVCAAFDEEQYCTTCQTETTEEACLSHRIDDTGEGGVPTFLRGITSNSTDDMDDKDVVCHWIPANESASHMANVVSTLIWSLVMILSCVPMTLSSVYKEIALGGETDLDPILLNGYIAGFQFLFSLVLSVPAGMASSPPVYPSEVPLNLWNGLKCYAGIGSIFTGCHTDEMCAGLAPLFVNVYLLLNVLYNILIIYILKYGSSNVLWLALTIMVVSCFCCCLTGTILLCINGYRLRQVLIYLPYSFSVCSLPQPIGNLAFSLPFMPGGGAEIHPSDIIGLLVILSGLVLYRFGTAIVEILLPATWISSGSLASSFSSLRDDENDLTENLLGDVHDNTERSAGDDGVSV